MKTKSLIRCAVGTLFFSFPLHAAMVFLEVTGTVSDTFSSGNEFGNEGEAFEILIAYRSDLEDADPTSYFGQYFDDDLQVSLKFLESGKTLQGTGGSINVTSILGPDGVTLVPEIMILSGFPELGAFFFGFRDEDGSEIRDTDIPTQFSSAEDYDFVGFSVFDLSPRSGGITPIPPLISGEVTLVSIPEPSSLLLFCLGVPMIFLRRR